MYAKNLRFSVIDAPFLVVVFLTWNVNFGSYGYHMYAKNLHLLIIDAPTLVVVSGSSLPLIFCIHVPLGPIY
jgi:hypothetical protein